MNYISHCTSKLTLKTHVPHCMDLHCFRKECARPWADSIRKESIAFAQMTFGSAGAGGSRHATTASTDAVTTACHFNIFDGATWCQAPGQRSPLACLTSRPLRTHGHETYPLCKAEGEPLRLRSRRRSRTPPWMRTVRPHLSSTSS